MIHTAVQLEYGLQKSNEAIVKLKASRLSQKLHKWLGLLVGLQLVIWTISGFYMVVVDIDIIHGDHLVKPADSKQNLSLAIDKPISFADIAKANPLAQSISLTVLRGQNVYKIESSIGVKLVNALNGVSLLPLNEAQASLAATNRYAANGKVKKATLIKQNPPTEIGSRPLPIWRVDFDDVWGSSFYIAPLTGELLTRRHTLWRVFDFVWMLHIMDYDERENVNNLLLRIVSSLALLLVLSGVWFLYFRLNVRGWLVRRLARRSA